MINIADILKDCPKGTKLYSPIFGDVYLDKIRPHLAIVVTTDKEQGDFKEEFLYDGRYGMNGECMLFPSKDQRDWSKFQRPFKDGDIIRVLDEYSDATFTYVAILKQIEKGERIYSHCFYNYEDDVFGIHDYLYDCYNVRFATEEEKQKLFKAIKDNGYKWNAETKTMEKLIVPKFKVGDIVKSNKNTLFDYKIIKITDTHYTLEAIPGANTYDIFIYEDENWKLIPNKFDITILKPFDKVLVRDSNESRWAINLFGFYVDTDAYPFKCCGYSNLGFVQCIPYEGNEHLLGTCDDCAEYYKNW